MLMGTAFVPYRRTEAFATLAASAATLALSDATTPAINLPSSISAGNLLTLEILGLAGSARTLATPSGWTEAFTTTGGSSMRRLSVFYKSASGSEGSTVTVTFSGSMTGIAAIARRYTGAATSSLGSASTTGTSSSPNPPNLAPGLGTHKVVWIAGEAVTGGGIHTTDPTSYSGGIQADADGASTTTFIRSVARSREAASEDPGAFAINASSFWIAYTLGIQPA